MLHYRGVGGLRKCILHSSLTLAHNLDIPLKDWPKIGMQKKTKQDMLYFMQKSITEAFIQYVVPLRLREVLLSVISSSPGVGNTRQSLLSCTPLQARIVSLTSMRKCSKVEDQQEWVL